MLYAVCHQSLEHCLYWLFRVFSRCQPDCECCMQDGLVPIAESNDKRGSTLKVAMNRKHDNTRSVHSMLMMEPPTIPTAPAGLTESHGIDEDDVLLDSQVCIKLRRTSYCWFICAQLSKTTICASWRIFRLPSHCCPGCISRFASHKLHRLWMWNSCAFILADL